ncbi:MAG: hypothetical protein ABSB10_03010 [Candidatus Bathyarchaeia archaeon]|jgi:hypothetical protein
MHRKIGIIALTSFIIFFLVVSTLGNAFARTKHFGVNGGDFFVYNVSLVGEPIPDFGIYYVGSATYQISISYVIDDFADQRVTIWMFFDYANGVNNTEQRLYVETYLISPDLSVNDKIDQYSTIVVDQTIQKSYFSGNRETNHVTFPEEKIENSPYSIKEDTYFDKTTGMFVESTVSYYENENSVPVLTATYSLKETNVWTVLESSSTTTPSNSTEPSPSIPEFQPIVAISFLMATIVFTATARKRKIPALNLRRLLSL